MIDDTDRAFKNPNSGRVYDTSGLSPTICTMQGGNLEPKIVEHGGGRKVNEKTIPVQSPDIRNKIQNGRRYKEDGDVSFTLTSMDRHGVMTGTEKEMRIRKLTPRECWKLMGFTEEDFAKAEAVNSNTQLYKQAGNSIVVQVLEAIFKEMYD